MNKERSDSEKSDFWAGSYVYGNMVSEVFCLWDPLYEIDPFLFCFIYVMSFFFIWLCNVFQSLKMKKLDTNIIFFFGLFFGFCARLKSVLVNFKSSISCYCGLQVAGGGTLWNIG